MCARIPSGAAGAPPLDRAQFPILKRRVGRDGDRPLVYLDSAATSLVPLRVTDALTAFLHTSCANIHRGAHTLAEEATDAYERSREHLAAFLHVDDPARLLFTHGATESLNLAARCWAEEALAPGDVVAVAEDNHHANIVCWQMLAARRGLEIAWIPLQADGTLDYGAWCRIAEGGPAEASDRICCVQDFGFLRAEDVLPPRPVRFEGEEFLAPRNIDAYLTMMYGDYMELPPEEKRKTHSPEILDFGDL